MHPKFFMTIYTNLFFFLKNISKYHLDNFDMVIHSCEMNYRAFYLITPPNY